MTVSNMDRSVDFYSRVPRIPWRFDRDALARLAPGVWNPDADPCELYDLAADFSQADDLAAKQPEKMRELTDLFWAEAATYNVLPLLGGAAFAWGIRPPEDAAGKTFTFYPGVENVAPGMIPPIYNRSYAISADLDIQRNTCFVEHTVPLRFSGYAGMDIGRDNGLPVSPSYYYYLRSPFPFEGTIEKVAFELH